jgi:dTDP-4-dehydrorhamnose 3,5-epimerase
MKLEPTSIPGCYQFACPVHADPRGTFVKAFRRSQFGRADLETDFREVFWTSSGENVLRGMHLQLPGPASMAPESKLVYCVAGSVMDVALDLRRGSPTFGKYDIVELSAEAGNACFLPSGVAHGFYVRRAPAVMVYHVTSEYVPELDAGIAWDSFGAPWPTHTPVLSERDASLPPLSQFESPFHFEPNTVAGRRA